MRKTAVVLAVILALTSPVWAQGKIGVGGSFWAGSPVFDAFAEVALGENAAMRFNVGTLFSGGGFSAFTLDATLLIVLGLEAVQPYFGVGAGAFVLAGGGAAGGIFTVNALLGIYVPFADTFGFYGQTKFLGQVSGGGFTGSLLPGVGLYVNF